MANISAGKYHTLPDVLRVVMKRRWIILLTFSLSLLVGVVFMRRTEPEFQARSTIELEEPASAVSSGYWWDQNLNMSTESQVIKSLPVLLAVAKRMGLVEEDVRIDDLAQDEAPLVKARRLQGQIRTEPRTGTRIMDIMAVASEATQARDLANFVAEEYKNYRLERAYERSVDTREMTATQQKKLEGLLDQAEDRVRAFREENGLLGVEASVEANIKRLSEIEDEMRSIQNRRKRVAEIIRTLEEQNFLLGDSVPAFELTGAPESYERLRSQLVDSIFEKREKQLVLTDTHPDVQFLGEKIDSLVRQMFIFLNRSIREMDENEQHLIRARVDLEARNGEHVAAEVELARLERQVARYQTMLDNLDATFQQAQLGGTMQGANVKIVEYALVPRSPSARTSVLPIASFALLGSILGLGLAFLRESFDFSLETVHDVESVLSLPVLGIIPHFDLEQNIDQERRLGRRTIQADQARATTMVVHYWPKSPVSESFQSLRMLLRRKEGSKIILVTSATPQEGKSFVTSNLAISFAQGQMKTLLVEANTRRPTMHKVFHMENDVGLTNIASEGADWKQCLKGMDHFLYHGLELESVQMSPGLDNLHVLNAGPTPVHPPTTLDILMQRSLLKELQEKFDVIIVDCPPTLPVADSSVLAPYVDGIVLVYRIGKTARDVILRAIDQLKGVGGNIMGVVLNDVDYHGPYFYSRYSYRYQYRRYVPESDFGDKGVVAKVSHWFKGRHASKPPGKSPDQSPPP